MGMMYTPGTLNIPKIPLPKVLYDTDEDKFDDGFVVEGQGVVKIACYDDVNDKNVPQYAKPLNQRCQCDNKGCRFGDAPLCQGPDYKGTISIIYSSIYVNLSRLWSRLSVDAGCL